MIERRASSRARAPGEADEAGLGGAVVRLARRTEEADHRGEVDDAPPAGLHHAGRHPMGDAVGAVEVGVEHPPPLVGAHAEEQAVVGDARAVDEDGDGTEPVLDGADAAVHRVDVGDVERDGEAPRPDPQPGSP